MEIMEWGGVKGVSPRFFLLTKFHNIHLQHNVEYRNFI